MQNSIRKSCLFIVAAMIISLLCFDNSFAASGSSIKISNCTVPNHQYAGKCFPVKGTVKSSRPMNYLKVGVKNKKRHWVNGVYVTVNPKSRTYNLLRIDPYVRFGRLKPGVYVYTVEARNTAGHYKLLVSRRFTVSKIFGKHISKPASKIKRGTPVTLKGYVRSKFRIRNVKVGITSNNRWKRGFYVSRNINSSSFNIKSVDHLIRFGKLPNGVYKYRVYASDVCGKNKYVTSKRFVVGKITKNINSSTVSYANGRRLYFNSRVIGAIGKQPVSGPCGQYAMAYCRTILDGRFPLKRKYNSYYRQLYYEYGFGSHYAYWYKANGSPVWYSTNKSCYRAVFRELLSGKPCIINLHNNYTGNNHFVAVIGFTKGTTSDNVCLRRLIAIDPGYGQMVYLKNMNYSNNGNPEAVFF